MGVLTQRLEERGRRNEKTGALKGVVVAPSGLCGVGKQETGGGGRRLMGKKAKGVGVMDRSEFSNCRGIS